MRSLASAASLGSNLSRRISSWDLDSRFTFSAISSSCSSGVHVRPPSSSALNLSALLASSCFFRPPTLFAKNSSKFEAVMLRKVSLSRRGMRSLHASARTRQLNASHEISGL